jgi:hypothetical protein
VARNDVKEQTYLKQLYAEMGISDISDPGGVVSPRDPNTGAVLNLNSGNVQPAYGTPIGTPVYYPAPSRIPAPGRVSFTSSRGGNALQVGDTWLVSITGATPNAQVTAKVGSDVTPMGTTDAAGNFTLSGAARTADVGSWNESWFVGGVPSGSFSFTVQAAVTPEGKKVVSSSGAGSGTGTGSDAGAGGGTGAGSGGNVPPLAGRNCFSLFGKSDMDTCISQSIPIESMTFYVMIAAGVAAFFMFGKGGR